MPESTREEKIKIFSQLPSQLQEVLFSDATADTIDKIGKKYGLNDDQISLLARIIGDIILRIAPITSLAQEINSKITSDAQIAMNLAQELYTELLAPAMVSAPSAPAAPASTPAPATIPPAPQPVTPTPRPADEYREPTFSMPEIIDLRKMPTPTPTAPPRPIMPPTPITPISPAPKPITPPLTFTRPIEPIKLAPLIEAEPHKIPPLVSAPIPTSTPPASEPKPQYIMRPSGLPPTDLPENVLDLRKDRGEF